MMRGHGITTAFADVRAATVAACFLEESADLQMRMLAAAGGDAQRIRAFTREEAELTRDQTGPGVAAGGRAWEYYAAVAARRAARRLRADATDRVKMVLTAHRSRGACRCCASLPHRRNSIRRVRSRCSCPSRPGGAPDIAARVVGQKLAESLGQPVVVENRPGSNGNIAAEATAKAAPDGYTLMLCADAQIVINPHLYAKLPFDPLKDLTPIATRGLERIRAGDQSRRCR